MFDYLSPEQRAVVMWQHSYYGGFYMALFHAICKADEENLYKLSLGFPAEVKGYRKYTEKEGWWQEVLEVISAHEEKKERANEQP